DADDAGPGNGQDRAAIAAGPKGCVDIESALAGGKQRNRLAAEDGNMPGRTHARATDAGGPREGKLQANRPIAPRIPAFSSPFRRKSRKTGAIADPARPKEETTGQTLVSAWNVLGCHRASSVNKGAKPALALHHLVTTLSVNKRLMAWLLTFALWNLLFRSVAAGDAPCTQSVKTRPGRTIPDCFSHGV